jgi:hypothetical protein
MPDIVESEDADLDPRPSMRVILRCFAFDAAAD